MKEEKSIIVGGIFKLGGAGLKIWTGAFEAAKGIGGTVAYFGSNLSPALLSVGYIVGLNVAILIFLVIPFLLSLIGLALIDLYDLPEILM